ncbi:MAG: DUF885 family protein [Acidobacteriota bacterium]
MLRLLLCVFAAAAPTAALGSIDDLLQQLNAVRVENHTEQEYEIAAAALRELLRDADALAFEDLDRDDLLDLRLVRAMARRRLFEIEELELHKVSPIRYLSLPRTNALFTRPCSLPDRAVEGAAVELERFPRVLEQGRINLGRPAATWTENAVVQTRYVELMLSDMLQDVCVDDSALRERLLRAGRSANDAVLTFRSWLETDLLPRSDRSPTWSPEQVEVYQFEVEFLNDWGVGPMLELAEKDAKETREAMIALAKRIHPSGDLQTVWKLMKEEAPPWDEVRPMAERYVELATDWILGPGAHLLELPERFDYGVEITSPLGRRTLSFGGASYGPTMAGRISGYYVLTPLEPWLTEEERFERLRAYNPYWTNVISTHEWIGHNVQRAFAERFADTPTRRAFQSIYLSQAWSFYLEKLLEDEGYFEDTLPHMEALKTRMARLQMRMWRVQRILTKLRMARDEMTFEEAVQAYVDEIGMEPANAFIEVQRDSQTPSPPAREIVGEYVILEMRAEFDRRFGQHATRKAFHEALLRYGNLPLPIVRDLMFGDD